MKNTLAYCTSVLYKDFYSFAVKELQNLGLSYGNLPFIIYIGKNEGCTQGELTNALNIDWGYSQRSIAKLQEGEFITKKKQETGKRAYRLDLTDKGREAFNVSHEVFELWDREKTAKLTKEEIETFFSIMKKLI